MLDALAAQYPELVKKAAEKIALTTRDSVSAVINKPPATEEGIPALVASAIGSPEHLKNRWDTQTQVQSKRKVTVIISCPSELVGNSHLVKIFWQQVYDKLLKIVQGFYQWDDPEYTAVVRVKGKKRLMGKLSIPSFAELESGTVSQATFDLRYKWNRNRRL